LDKLIWDGVVLRFRLIGNSKNEEPFGSRVHQGAHKIYINELT